MSSAVPEGSASLERQVRRLHFSDTGWETRFREERQAAGLTRVRIMLVVATFVVTALGLADVAFSAGGVPDYVHISLQLRFLVVAPIWLLALVSTGLPGHGARADTLYATAMVGVCWALAFMKWHNPVYFPQVALAPAVAVDVALALLISVFTFPMRFVHLAAGTVLATVGTGVFFLVTQPSGRLNDGRNIALTLTCLGTLVLVVMRYREVAERRTFAQREQLAALNAELARLNAEKNEFMAIASHDLRAPLAAVRGLAEQLRAGHLAEEKRERAHAAIHELAGKMLGLVNDYLGAHAAESGTLPMTLARVNLQAQAEQAGARHAPIAAGKAQRVDVAAGPALWVRADEALLGQVVDNFVSNALKFSPRGASVRLGLARAEDGRVARLEVSDEGPGIAPEERANLFRKFARMGARPTGGETSHGLGLAVAKRLAEAMGARVGCEAPAALNADNAGTGATFWIELPCEDVRSVREA